jgi:predicted transglutaminase-like cysteine proteinase
MEFLDRNGDCEDFAIIKFFSLLELGFTNDQLRIVVVKDTQRNVVHAVVSVSIGGRVYLLDSLFAEPVPHEYVLHYVPVYSVNLDTRWAHFVTPQIRNQFLDQIASAVVGQN